MTTRTPSRPRELAPGALWRCSRRLSEVRRSIASCRRLLDRRPNDVRVNARFDCLSMELLFLETVVRERLDL